jgi:hypothetical protein
VLDDVLLVEVAAWELFVKGAPDCTLVANASIAAVKTQHKNILKFQSES